MIKKINDTFFLQTANTSYIMRLLPSGQLEHLHYGAMVKAAENTSGLFGKAFFQPGNMISYSSDSGSLALENTCLEVSGQGKGDIREPFIGLIFEDGSRTTDFIFEGFEIHAGKTSLSSLPSSYGSEECVSELSITLKDRNHDIYLTLLYQVYEETDVITKTAIIKNSSDKPVNVTRLMSSQLDFYENDFCFTTFGGAWTREMNGEKHRLSHGKLVNSSVCGASSNRNNPFTILSREDATEEYGECYGFNLVYSGNHYTALEADSMGGARLVTGINPEGFSFLIESGESFEAPEAVMTFSGKGFRGMSHNLHHFIRKHIVRGTWRDKERPVLLNSWEAAYFDITENKLLRMAKAAAEAGVELFVMDDGWFGERNNDKSSLGDWTADKTKLPGGLLGISEKIHGLGLMFGIWLEPEMVNEDSECFRKHPDWALRIPKQAHSEGRNQMVLDLTKKEVRDFVVSSVKNVLDSAAIEYVKWDMNRIFSDVYSTGLPPLRQGEVAHRYIMGLYSIMEELTDQYPEVLFEGCASGGNRFDLGMLCYMPQIWASDNTDAYSRAVIQNGLSYGYPQSAYTAHVSGCPNHQTLRSTSLDTRFNIASAGILGYECNLAEMKKEELQVIKEQIAFYKENRRLFQFGDYYRLKCGEQTRLSNGQYQFMLVQPDRKKAVGIFLQGLNVPNSPRASFKAAGLCEDMEYRFHNRRFKYNVKEFGDLINTVSPIHVKRDSLLHNVISRVVKMDNENCDVTASGSLLMNCGIRLNEAYVGTGYNEEVRCFKDFESRMYIIEGA